MALWNGRPARQGTGNAYSLTDANGLSLYVVSGGSKIWHFRYYWFGKQQRMSLGSHPQIGLKEPGPPVVKRVDSGGSGLHRPERHFV